MGTKKGMKRKTARRAYKPKRKEAWEVSIDLHDRPLKRENWFVRLQRTLGLRGKFQ